MLGLNFARNIAALLLLLPAAAMSAPEPPKRAEYCGNLEKIVQHVDRCDRNQVIAEIALRCVHKLQTGSAKVATDLGEKFSSKANSQAASLGASVANLQLAQDSLQGLERKNDLAIEDTLRYFLNLVHPEEADETSLGVNSDEILKRSPCFADNKKRLLQALALMERNKKGLRSARDALQNLSGKHLEGIEGLIQAALQPLQHNNVIASSAPRAGSKRKEEKNRPSDITGTKKKK